MTVVPALALAATIVVPLWAWIVRGRAYAIFGLVILALALPGAVVTHARLHALLAPAFGPWLDAAFAYGVVAAAVHLLALVRPRLRRPPFRLAVSLPGMTFVSAGFLAGLWLLALWPVRVACVALGWTRARDALAWLDLVPFAVAAASIVTSVRHVPEIVRVRLGGATPGRLTRLPVERYRRSPPAPLARRPLRLVQITDPHLGPWQPVDLLHRRIDELVQHDPDLVLLTGDFLTMEGAATPGALAEALAPLARLPGRCFAIFGNHDHASPDEVVAALDATGVRLLVDEEVAVSTPAGAVQIVGADYVGRGREEHIAALLARWPRRADHLRLFLLHDPLGFRHVPPGDVDLTLSGHTHGGQLGLVSFGLDWTVLARTAWPDHGLFGLGTSRLYVHRGTGFYGFPLRVGVPAECSLLEVVLDGD